MNQKEFGKYYILFLLACLLINAQISQAFEYSIQPRLITGVTDISSKYKAGLYTLKK